MSEPERTEDGHHVVIGGRRWRATDPSIPDALRSELVNELMAARRALRDEADAARARVHDAKVALGERADPWWAEPTADGRRERIAAALRTLARHRAPDGTTCPSDAARAVGGQGWRGLMDETRAVARELAGAGELEVVQQGLVLDPEVAWRGPVRIRRADR